MKKNKKPYGYWSNEEYWSKEKCHEESLKFENRKDFHLKRRATFDISMKNGWLDDICSHMKPINNKFRCIYAYEFDDNYVYVGLTGDIKDRNNRHFYNKNSSVYKHHDKTKIKPKLKQLTDYIDVQDAKIKESEYLEKYKKDGWNILNQTKTGSIGSNIVKWTKIECEKVAKKCKNKTEFYKKYSGAAGTALKMGWLDEVCSHMEEIYVKRGQWNNYENCLEEAKKQKTKTNFRINSSGAFKSCVKNEWKEKIWEEMKWNKQKNS